MIIFHFLFALIVATLITSIFVFIFRRTGPWSVFIFFLLVFLGTWAGGIWLMPMGTTIWNIYWLPFLIAGIIFALLISLVETPKRYRVRFIKSKKVIEGEEEDIVSVLWSLFGLLIIFLILGILIRYL